MRKQRSFVLLEVLIAFALVSVSIFPFLRHPYQHMRKELDLLFEMELERHIQNTIGQWEASLYAKHPEIGKRIFNKEECIPFTHQSDVEVALSKQFKRTYTQTVSISWKKQKEDKNRILSSLVTIQIELTAPRQKALSTTAQLVARKKI